MKKLLSALLVVLLLFAAVLTLGSCGEKKIRIAVPNDATNEARALLLLEANGLIRLDPAAGLLATTRDIIENPYNIEFVEVEAAQLPRTLADVDYAVINSNYALPAGLNPTKDALAIENSYSAYSNILAVRAGNETSAKTRALVAALSSARVKDFITAQYGGAVIGVVGESGDGFDPTLDYTALSGATITVAASPTPHAEILAVAADILREKNITLKIREFTDYVQPNVVVEDLDADANYFQHLPYLENFNTEKGTHIVSVLAVHVEPMGIYSKTHTKLDITKETE